MGQGAAMFRGCFEHTIDEKGRMSIPAKFREALETTFEPPLIVTRKKECLVSYPADEWRIFEAQVNKLPAFDPKFQNFRHFVYAPAQECPLDRTGRVLVPPILRTFAGLEREVVLAGLGKTFEIWSKERYDQMMNAMLDDYDEIAQAVGQFGL
jgi:MraZ protein